MCHSGIHLFFASLRMGLHKLHSRHHRQLLRQSAWWLGFACWRKRSVVALLAVLYGVAASGMALPLPGPAKTLTERFPCENCPCGCSNAKTCWSNCCCHTPEERLAWAEKNGVTPPRFAVQLAAFKSTSKTAASLRPCCAAKRSCCASPTVSSRAVLAPRNDPSGNSSNHTKRSRAVSAFQMLACQGFGELWLSIGQAPAPPVVELPSGTRQDWVKPTRAVLFSMLPSGPPCPPPRVVS